MKSLFYLACFLALAGTAATCNASRAGILEDYIATLPPEVQREPSAIRQRLKQATEIVSATNATRRAAADEVAFLDLVRIGSPPLVPSNVWANVTTNENAATVEEARADLVQRRIEGRIMAGTTAQKNAAVVLRAQLAILAERIARRGGNPYGPNAGQPTEEVARTRRGPPRWEVLGLAELPTLRDLGGVQ
jgi:hypothetical protein